MFEIKYYAYNAKNYSLPINIIEKLYPDFAKFLINGKLDLGDPLALLEYNKRVFQELDGIKLFIPQGNLIPTAGLHRCIADIIINHYNPQKIIEIGTGASAIMALLFAYKNIEVIATELEESFKHAMTNVKNNNLQNKIKLIESNGQIMNFLRKLKKIFPVDIAVSLPPYYERKIVEKSKGFLGKENELYTDSNLNIYRSLLDEWYQNRELIPKIGILWKNYTNFENIINNVNYLDTKQITIDLFKIQAGNRLRFFSVLLFDN